MKFGIELIWILMITATIRICISLVERFMFMSYVEAALSVLIPVVALNTYHSLKKEIKTNK